MPSQVYTNRSDKEYRAVSKEGNGALILLTRITTRESMNTRKPWSRSYLRGRLQVCGHTATAGEQCERNSLLSRSLTSLQASPID